MYDYSLLRGTLKTKNISIASLAKEIGLSEGTLLRKIHGNSSFRDREIQKIMDYLAIPSDKVDDYFFVRLVKKGEPDQKL